jgi:hypothetical protein
MAKDKKPKLPKSIAGVKIPKELRKAGNAAAEFARGPVVGEMVSAALLAAAASLTDSKTKGRAMREAETLASGTMKEASAIGQSVRKALIDAARHLLDDFEAPAKPRAAPKPKARPKPRKPAASGRTKAGA